MDHVLARVKKQNQTPFSKLMSNHTLFDNVDISLEACIEYSPNHNLDEDSWFKIENFSTQEYCLDILKKAFDSKEYNNLEKEKFCDISYLIAIQSSNFYFQKITPSLFINRKFLAFGDVAKIEENNDRLIHYLMLSTIKPLTQLYLRIFLPLQVFLKVLIAYIALQPMMK